jgi:hypothetical protein
MRLKLFAILGLSTLLAACAWPVSKSAPPAFLKSVRQVNPDGTLAAVEEKNLSPFQQFIRTEVATSKDQIAGALLLEIDTPNGIGNEGEYIAVMRLAGGAEELRYFQQNDHLPRIDRYFHRDLTPEEVTRLDAVLKEHPIAKLGVFTTQAITPASQPATAPALEAMDQEESYNSFSNAILRLTDAQGKEAITTLLDSPSDDAPAAELALLLQEYRQRGALACVFRQAMPKDVKVLFTDPYKKVLTVWVKDQEIKAQIAAPVNGAVQDAWFGLENGQWSESQAPPEYQDAPLPAPVPTTEAELPVEVTTQPLAGLKPWPPAAAVVATLPTAREIVKEFRINQDKQPWEERWWTESGANFTTVWHFVPAAARAGVTTGFVVPGFVFDVEHMAVSGETLYLIHDGQLFSLPIPKAAQGAG